MGRCQEAVRRDDGRDRRGCEDADASGRRRHRQADRPLSNAPGTPRPRPRLAAIMPDRRTNHRRRSRHGRPYPQALVPRGDNRAGNAGRSEGMQTSGGVPLFAEATMTDQLHRTTFRTSREMDFFSAKELVTQTGHAVREWPLVITKELISNGLDACEEAGVTPVIAVVADSAGISVSDNGPGLPETTLQAQLDFKVRASNREAYVSPCRGAQGHALKTLIPMPHVI